MWLFTRYGFYSVVLDKADANRLQVRARIRGDLERLRTFARQLADVEMDPLIPTPDGDYAFRCIIARDAWIKVAAALAGDIDYPNFKNQTHGEGDRDAAYMDVWTTMHELQLTRGRAEPN